MTVPASSPVASPAPPRLCHREFGADHQPPGSLQGVPVAGTAIMTFGLYLLSRLDPHTSRPAQAAAMAAVGLGIWLVMQVLENSVAHRDLGTATSASSFFRSIGGAFGVAVYGAILNRGLAERLANLGPAGVAVDPAAVQGGPEALRSLPPAATPRWSRRSPVPSTPSSWRPFPWPSPASSSSCSSRSSPCGTPPTSASKAWAKPADAIRRLKHQR